MNERIESSRQPNHITPDEAARILGQVVGSIEPSAPPVNPENNITDTLRAGSAMMGDRIKFYDTCVKRYDEKTAPHKKVHGFFDNR